ncbi:response regulator [Sphingomicrobium nitratireducens]|uniref:response regulator n=1 Tax=Sphingomicrobium nitratireducens TaxID=2964666 RepID=UPI00223F7513
MKILVVEDEYIIALDIAHTLEDAGYDVLGPCEDVAGALALIEGELPDGAILDVQLDNETVHPVARRLSEAGVPIVFHSGHAQPCDLQKEFEAARFCSKPCAPQQLVETVGEAIDGAAKA